MLPDSPSWNQLVPGLYSPDLFCILSFWSYLILFHIIVSHVEKGARQKPHMYIHSQFPIYQEIKRWIYQIPGTWRFKESAWTSRDWDLWTSPGSSKSSYLWGMWSSDEPEWYSVEMVRLSLEVPADMHQGQTWEIHNKWYQFPTPGFRNLRRRI